MSRYAKTLIKEDSSGWNKMFNVNNRPLLKIGDEVKVSRNFENTSFGKFLGNDIYTIDEIRVRKNWDWLPFTQYVGLKGNNKDLFFNTILEKV